MQLSLCLPDSADLRVAINVGHDEGEEDGAGRGGAVGGDLRGAHCNDNGAEVSEKPHGFGNTQLGDLHAIVLRGEPLFREFVAHLRAAGFFSLAEFMREPEGPVTRLVISTWLGGRSRHCLLDGLGKPYANAKGRWLLAAWVFREAPEQRLKPLVDKLGGGARSERAAIVLDSVRAFAGRVFVDDEDWSWPVIRETFRHRLEGSRRAKLGYGVEKMVRRELQGLNQRLALGLSISDREQKFGGHTVDVVIEGVAGRILMPVKSRTTEGGGHGLLYTRDLAQSIRSVARSTDLVVPVVVAERFSEDAAALGDGAIVIESDPSGFGVSARIRMELELRLPLFRSIAGRGDEAEAVA